MRQCANATNIAHFTMLLTIPYQLDYSLLVQTVKIEVRLGHFSTPSPPKRLVRTSPKATLVGQVNTITPKTSSLDSKRLY